MQRMLLHSGNAQQSQHRQHNHHLPNTTERSGKRLDHSVIPLRRKVSDLIQVIAKATDTLCGVWPVAKSRPQLVVQDVLVDDRGCGYAQRATKTANED